MKNNQILFRKMKWNENLLRGSEKWNKMFLEVMIAVLIFMLFYDWYLALLRTVIHGFALGASEQVSICLLLLPAEIAVLCSVLFLSNASIWSCSKKEVTWVHVMIGKRDSSTLRFCIENGERFFFWIAHLAYCFFSLLTVLLMVMLWKNKPRRVCVKIKE